MEYKVIFGCLQAYTIGPVIVKWDAQLSQNLKTLLRRKLWTSESRGSYIFSKVKKLRVHLASLKHLDPQNGRIIIDTIMTSLSPRLSAVARGNTVGWIYHGIGICDAWLEWCLALGYVMLDRALGYVRHIFLFTMTEHHYGLQYASAVSVTIAVGRRRSPHNQCQTHGALSNPKTPCCGRGVKTCILHAINWRTRENINHCYWHLCNYFFESKSPIFWRKSYYTQHYFEIKLTFEWLLGTFKKKDKVLTGFVLNIILIF